MHVTERTMKLRLRAALVVCGALSFCAICLTFNRLPTLHDASFSVFTASSQNAKRNFEEPAEFPHIFTYRKRLNKSNYSSDNISPEMGKQPMEVKVKYNDTNEDNKYQSDSINQENPNDTNDENQKAKSVSGANDANVFNVSNAYVDKLLNMLQTSNGLKFNFEKTRKVPYANFLKLQTQKIRRKGMGLPIYENYNGG